MIRVVCVKHGNKYSATYVNRLYNMTQRHLTLPHVFVCFTEDTSGLDSNIQVIDLPDMPLGGWWYKTYMFAPQHHEKYTVNLYFDLDSVIVNNIDQFLFYKSGKFVGLRDLAHVFRPNWYRLGSAVMRWQSGQHEHIWTDLCENFDLVKRFRGDQDWIWHQCRDCIEFFPEEWTKSYKWQIRNKSELIRVNGRQQFSATRNPAIPPDTSVLAFHGTPAVDEVCDPVIVENWR